MEPGAPTPEKRGANRPRGAAPVLLPTFAVATVAVVLAVVALDRIDSDVGDAVAILLVLVLTGVLLTAIWRLAGEDGSPDGEDGPGRSGEPPT